MSDIRDMVMAEPLFDCHEHQAGFAEMESDRENLDYKIFVGYAGADLCTAAGRNVDFKLITPGEFFRLWEYCRVTGYGRATELACKTLFGLDFTLANVPAINAAIAAFIDGKSSEAVYADIFGKANICGVMCDRLGSSPTRLDVFDGRDHPDNFYFALRCDDLILTRTAADIEKAEALFGVSLHSLADLDRAMDDYAAKAASGGKLKVFKCGTAYLDSLHFPDASYEEADAVFQNIRAGKDVCSQPLKGYLFHKFIQRAGSMELPVQIHTGYQAGNGDHDLSLCDPTPLAPVLMKYPKVQFDLFHAGWPYTAVLGAMGKKYPNTHLNLCWAWSMNPAVIRRVLVEWLASVPYNKILGFGGDTWTPFSALGYAAQAREGIAAALEDLLADSACDLPTAHRIARAVMHENARKLYDV